MTLRTGLALLLGLTIGMWTASELQITAQAGKVTARQVTACMKSDKGGR